MVKNPPAMWETQIQSLGQEDPLEKRRTTTLVFLPGESHGQSHLAGYILGCQKESDTAEQQTLHFSSLSFGVVCNAAQLQQSLESPMDCKIKPVNPKRNQP